MASRDTRDKVATVVELKAATLIAAEIVWGAVTHPGPMPRHKTEEEIQRVP